VRVQQFGESKPEQRERRKQHFQEPNTAGEQGGQATKLDEARTARDGLAKSTGKKTATVTGGYNTETGEVAARGCSTGACAEDNVVNALGGDKTKVKFTEATRPRTGEEVPVCERFEQKYGRNAFPPNTKFKSDQQ